MWKKLGITMLMLLIALALEASDYEDSGHTFYSTIQGQKYASFLPEKMIEKSLVLDLTDENLPKPLNEIIGTAFVKLEEITKERRGWDVYRITLTKWHKDNKKWFYAVGFNSYASNSFDNLTVLVTIDGHVGDVVRVQR